MIRILHVDDEKDAHELTEFNLRKHSVNLQIEQAESAQTALEMLSEREYDCVICDYMMPDMDGLQLLKVLREAGNDLPFVFLTCQGNEEIAAEAFRAGADDYFTKEVGFAHYDRLTHSIQRIVEAKAQRDERNRADEKIRHLNLVLKAIRNVNQLITTESDIDRILRGTCDSLVETRGYHFAWIALLDEEGSFTGITGARGGEDFAQLEKRILAGETVICAEKALTRPDIVATESTKASCEGCPMSDAAGVRGSMTVRLEYGDRIYGVLNVTIPSELVADKEEQSLFNEVAGDISLALHRNEIEEKRKHAEEALRKSEEWFRALTESTSDWIWEVDVNGVYTYVGPRIKDLLGYELDEIVGKTPFDLMPPQVTAPRAAAFQETMKSREPMVGLENVKLHKEGREVVLETSGVPIFDTEGKLSGYRGVDRDITERKRSEKVRESIYRISEAANAAKNLQELFSSIHGIIGELMPAENFYIALHNHDSDMLSFPYFVDRFDETPAPKELGKGLTEYVLRTGRPLLATPDVFERLVEKGEVESIGAPSIDWLGVPLRTPEETIGVLVVQTYTEGVRYGEEEEKILEFVSAQVAMVIERKRAEEALRISENEYRYLYEESPAIILLIGIDGRIRDVNKTSIGKFGYLKDNIIGMRVADFVIPEHQEKAITHLERDFKGEYTPHAEFGIYANDGSIHTVLFSPGCVRLYEEDKPTGVLITGIDITERKRAEEALQQSKELLRATIESTADGILVLDDKGKVIHSNARFAEMWRIPEKYIEIRDNEKLLEYVQKQLKEPKEFLSSVRQLSESPEEVLDTICFTDGRIYERYSSPIIRNGELAGGVRSFRDVTDRLRAENELGKAYRLLEQERKMFAAGSAVAFRWKNQEGWPVEYVSSNVKATLGYITEEFESGQVRYSEIITKEDIERVTEELRANSERGVDRFEHKPYRLLRKDGKTIWVSAYITILRDEAGNITHYLGYVIDITERDKN